MLITFKAETHDLTSSNLESIYNWRFKHYPLFFATQYVPSLQEHKMYIHEELMRDSTSWFFSYYQDEIASCCSLKKGLRNKNNEILDLTLGRVMVDPRWRGRGFAKQTITYSIECMTKKADKYKVTLEVLNTNSNAISLYEKLGFVDVQSKENMIIMELQNYQK
jgi:ribosomal protein S18 acetylase RimI-like enzyme